MDYSIVIPVYFNETSLVSLFEELHSKVFQFNKHLKGEVIFVNDGSRDNSLEVLKTLWNQHRNLVKIINLSRNFGQIAALHAGYAHAKGQCIVTMSADLQDPVVLINDMLKAHFEESFEKVICTRIARKESWYRSITSKISYSLVKLLAFKEMPVGGFDYFLMSARVKDLVIRTYDANPYLQGQVMYVGYETKFLYYERQARHSGESKWNFTRKLTYFIDSVLGYSYFPIRLMSLVGILVSFVGFCYAVFIVVSFLLYNNPVKGWAPIMITVLVLGGLQMFLMGIMGEYIWRILSQVRNRPLYVIEKLIE